MSRKKPSVQDIPAQPEVIEVDPRQLDLEAALQASGPQEPSQASQTVQPEPVSKKQLVEFLVGSKKVTAGSATTSVTVKKNDGTEVRSVKQESIPAVLTETLEPARLWIEYGITKNLGNYESAKISIGLSIPIGADKQPGFSEQVAETKVKASSLIESMIGRELDELARILREREAQDAAKSRSLFE